MVAQQLYKAASAKEAVGLAKQFQAEGRYNWFRGQVIDWRIKPTIVRRDEDERQRGWERLDKFDRWLQRQPHLQAVCQDVDAVIAIAQHYGLDTFFVDFTTDPEVAAFFATDGDPDDVRAQQKESGINHSSIILVDTEDLISTHQEWAEIAQEPDRVPRCVEIDVSNLWRLQAQRGVFLECKFVDIEADYVFDRIVFPYLGPILTSPTRDYIYPSRKSKLEETLDHYFEEEIAKEALPASLRAMFEMGAGSDRHPFFTDTPEVAAKIREVLPDARIISGESRNPLYLEECIEPGAMSLAPGWLEEPVTQWTKITDERYESVLSDVKWRIELPSDVLPRQAIEQMYLSFQSLIDDKANARSLLVDWKIVHPRIDDATDSTTIEIERALRRIWDGMRNLPYTDAQVSMALAIGAAMGHFCNCHTADGNRYLKSMRSILDSPIELEFASRTGSYSRAMVSEHRLLKAVRPDVADLLRPAYREQACELRSLLQIISSPFLLFEFEKFVQIFGEEIVPTQVLRRKQEAVFFSPTTVIRFGLP